MKILTINYEFPPLGGGASPVSYEIAKGLVKKGHRVDVVTMSYGKLPKFERRDGINIYRVKSIRRKKEMTGIIDMSSYILPALIKALKLNKKNNYDINHTHFIVPSAIVSYLLKKITGLKYIITSHGSDVLGYNQRFDKVYPFVKPIWRTVIKNSEAITTPSIFLKKEIGKIIKHPTKVIPNGIDPKKIKPMKKEKYILLVSRLFLNKGIQDFLRAIKNLDLSDWKVKIAGDGPYKKELISLTEKYSLEDKVKYLGWVDNNSKEYEELYGKAGIFICPSWFENMSVTLMEGMSAGCLTIATDAGGNKEVVGQSEYLYKPKDYKTLRKLIKQAIKKQKVEPETKNYDRIKKHFSWGKIVAKYEKTLQNNG